MTSRNTFDSRYYRRFYGTNGAHDTEKIHHLASGIHHLTAWWGISISSVFDVGAGMGMWRDWYVQNHPDVSVRSVDISEHACNTWNHEMRDISQWKPRGKYDLVICHSVLQYLDNKSVISAISNLAVSTRYVMYLELPTLSDFENVIDPATTDLQVYKRSGTWYRRHLLQHFRHIGAGLWTPINGVVMYELEASK